MKKNFFKKLSFVLALAMIVTALAPAAGVFAAAKPKLNAKEKTLFLSVDGKDEFDFNIANKKTGWSYKWTSANKKVATVNSKNGLVTAAGAGKTSVSVVIKDKKGEEVTTLKASVLVRDNIKELTITNLPEGDKLAVGASNDFNRSYKTVAGLTKGSQAITRWVVTDKDGKVATTATIDDKGVFTATEAGEYTITANAFQSKAKYNSWLADSEKYASYVTATATYKVTVAASIVGAKQVNLNKFDLTFDTVITADDVKKNLAVSYLVGTTKVKALVDGVSMDATGKVATVTMYLDFVKGSTYVAEYPEIGEAQFVAATTNVEDVVDIAILTTTAEVSKKKTVDIALYNKDGVNLAGDNNLMARVDLEKKDNNLVSLDGKDLYMYKVGDSVTLTATYHTYNWVEGKEVGNLTATGVVTCVDQTTEKLGTINAWTLADSAVSNFNDPKSQLFKGDYTTLWFVAKGTDENGDTMYSTNSGSYKKDNASVPAGTFKFTSSNTSVLIIGNDGQVYGVSEGTAVVVVYYNDVQIGACQITVVGAEKLAMASLSTNGVVLSNTVDEELGFTISAKNQLGDDFGGTIKSVEVIPNSTSDEAKKLYVGAVNGDDEYTFNAFRGEVAANKVAKGSYGFTVKIKDSNDNVVSLGLTVTVQEPSGTTPNYYRVETDKTSYDMKSGDEISTAKVKLTAYSYTSAGVKIAKLNVSDFVMTVTDADGTDVTSSISGSAISLVKKTTIATGSSVYASPAPTGVWLIKGAKYQGVDVKVQPVSFEVKNTQPAVAKSVNKLVTSKATNDLAGIIDDCFSFSVGDKTLTSTDILGNFSVDVVTATLSNGVDISFKTIYIYEEVKTGEYIRHKVDMGGVVVKTAQ